MTREDVGKDGLASGKLRWEPMQLVAVGTVAGLLEAAVGSRNDGGMSPPNMMVGP